MRSHWFPSRLALLIGIAGCASSVSSQPPPPAPAPTHPTAPVPARGDVESLLDSLSIRDKIAQLVIPWVAGSYSAFDDAALARAALWVDSLHIGGLLVSVGSPLDIAAKLNYLQQRSPLPLLIAADFESGTAIRLNGGTPFPPNMGIAATGRVSDAYDVGRVTALEGRAVGMHLSLAPVADVNNNPANPIINVRSFGEAPQQVAELVAAGVRGIEDHGMRATAKHFPGHGDTGTDSHLALPVQTATWPRLDTLELLPFRSAIAAGVTAVMSAHIALPGLDGGRTRPATLSPEILQSVLRDSLGFGGLIVTDALNMGGLIQDYGPGEAAVLAFMAGADLLLQPRDPGEAIDAMTQAVQHGRITTARLDRSVLKILELKKSLGLFTKRLVSLDSVPAVVGRAEFLDLARDMTARSLVLARDDGTVERLRRTRPALSLITLANERHPTLGLTLARELRARGYPIDTFTLWPQSGPASYDSARAVIGRGDVVLFVSAVRPTAGSGVIDLPQATATLINQTAAARPTVSVSLGSPYIINQTPAVKSYLLGWAAYPLTEVAVAQALGGEVPIGGTLPIAIPPTLSRGAGLRHGFR